MKSEPSTVPIAIVGLSCRFPGASGASAFWRLLMEGRDAVKPIPAERWKLAERTASHAWSAGLVDEIDAFDPEFFGISQHEARLMDPQQRLLMEVAWEALESAGLSREKLAGSSTGVFVGISTFDYSRIQTASAAHSGTGNALSIAANRISYFLDLRGPSLAVDTACSSSLAAVHLACESLRRGEVECAVTGGVNAILSPDVMAVLEEAGMLAPDGRCKTFDSRADGYVRGEGCGVVVLKRLPDAQLAGDRILAVIRGTALNQDGKSNGLTAPNGPAQEAVVKAALHNAGVSASDLDYIEAHGTGTALGDPIEAMALEAILSPGRDRTRPCWTGSVKTNIGHLEAAAGIAALIKTALALHHRVIPGSLHYQKANPRIPFDRMVLQVAEKSMPWPDRARPGLAGVSSFGFGGTNAHAILEAAPVRTVPTAHLVSEAPALITISAPSEHALRDSLQGFQSWLKGLNGSRPATLQDLAHATTVHRSHFNHRWACVAADWDTLAKSLNAAVAGQDIQGTVSGVRQPGGSPPLVLVFSGQGADFPGMGASLHKEFPAFREMMDACDAAAQAAGGHSLIEEMTRTEEQHCSQPMQVAFQISLCALLAAWGIQPDVVTGHSLGEIAAAWAAGILPIEEAMRLAVLRDQAMAARRGSGGMLAIHASPEEVHSLVGEWHPEAGIAAFNSPANTVVFSSIDLKDRLVAKIESSGFECQQIRTQSAFHSPQMDGARHELSEALAGLEPSAEHLPFYSSCLGIRIAGEELSAEYWGRQLREPVRFTDAINAISADFPGATLLEIGGHPVLAQAMQQCVAARGDTARVLSSVRRRQPERESLLRLAAQLYAEGRPIRWSVLNPTGHWVELPSYPWQHKRLWAQITPSVATPPVAPANDARTQQSAPASVSVEFVLNELKQSVANILGTTPQEVDVRAPFIEMGADSILLAMAAQRIQQRYGVQIRIRQLFEDLGNIEALAAFVVQHAKVTQPPPPKELAKAAAPAADQSVQALLNRQLDLLKEVMSQQLAVLGQAGGAAKALSLSRPIPAHPETPAAKPKALGPYRPLTPGTRGKGSTGFSPQQQAHLQSLIERYIQRTPIAKSHAAQWRPKYADCRASAGFRPSIKEMLYPIEGARAEGAKIWDVDGNAYLDISMDFGVNIFGHKAPFIEAALKEQIERGLALSARSRFAGETAALLCELTGMERAVFCQSGTEAVMTAVRLARLATGRSRIAFFSGSYHGHYDGFLAVPSGSPDDLNPVPAAPGIAPEVLAGALVLPYGDPGSLDILRAHADTLAAVLVEPIQSRHPELLPKEFLEEVRRITEQNGSLLIFDEMISGFRMHQGGAQKLLRIQADLATYGKVLGGGQPIAAVAGRAQFLNGIDGGDWNYGDDSFPEAEITFFAGTFSGNPLAMASARAVLTELKRRGPEFQEQLTAKTTRMAEELNGWFREQEVPVQIVHCGSLFRFAFKGNLDLLFFHLMERGVFIWEGRNCFLSAAHTEQDLEWLAQQIKESILEMRVGGFLTVRAKEASSAPAHPAIVRVPMTEAQRQLWVAARVDELANHAYTETLVLRGQGRIDAELLLRAFQSVIGRHESLRTTFSDDGRHQLIHPSAVADFRSVDASGLLGAEQEQARLAFMQDMTGRPFDLREAPLVRMGVFRLSADSQLLVVIGHHIVFDGWSLNLLINDLALCYTAELGQMPAPEPPKAQFRDYVAWLDAAMTKPEMEEHETFWKERLSGSMPELRLPSDQPKLPHWSWRGARVSSRLSPSLRDKLDTLGRAQGATLFMTLLAAWQSFLHRLSGEKEIVIGCPVLGRSMPNGMEIVGYLTHLLPVRSQCDLNESFEAFLQRSRSEMLDAFEHQDFPFSHMIRLLGRRSSPGEPALIRATFNLDRPREGPRFGGLKGEILSPDIRAAKFELSLNVTDLRHELLLEFDYNRDLFSAELAATIQDSFLGWLRQIAESPSRMQASLRLQAEPDRPSLPDPAPPTITESTLYAALHKRAAQSPDAVCLIAAQNSGAAKEAPRFTYTELIARASALAARLQELGVKPEDVVGLATCRGADRIIGLLGILQAGAAVLPLDSEYPEARLRFMLEDCATKLVVCDASAEKRFSSCRTVRIGSTASKAHQVTPNASVSSESLAYVIFTSGSTGTPKGVAITHGNVLSLINAMARRKDTPRGAMLHHSAFSFDASIWEIWSPCCSMARSSSRLRAS